jgi:hypothetical protein
MARPFVVAAAGRQCHHDSDAVGPDRCGRARNIRTDALGVRTRGCTAAGGKCAGRQRRVAVDKPIVTTSDKA